MRQILTYILWFAILLGTAACRKDGPSSLEGTIGFGVVQAETRTTAFESDDDLLDTGKGGGNFTVSAYDEGNETCYISSQRVWYFADDSKWRFWDEATNNVTHRYWPNSNLDFFAYMPYSPDLAKTGITIGTYSGQNGPSFSCDLPLDDQSGLQEFIYAYSTRQNKNSTSREGEKGVVQLRFVHPLSAVIIKLDQSYRMKVNSIGFSGIYNTGTYRNAHNTLDFDGNQDANFTYTDWTPSGEKNKSLTAIVDKEVPDEINYGSPIGGPYLVMPQRLEGVSVKITFERDDMEPETRSTIIYRDDVPSWEPGKRYTYSLTLGDPLEEIMFNVYVDEWDVIGYRNDIGVE